MIDGSVYIINYIYNILTNNNEKLNAMNNSFKKNKENLIKKIEKSYKENKKTLEEYLKAAFKELKDNKALEFANDNWDVKSGDVSYRWEQYLKNIKFNEKINNKIETCYNEYKKELEEALVGCKFTANWSISSGITTHLRF